MDSQDREEIPRDKGQMGTLKLSFSDKVIQMNTIDRDTWSGVTVACLFLPHPAEYMSKLRYLQLTSAGVDKWIGHAAYQRPDLPIATANGVHAYVETAKSTNDNSLLTSHTSMKSTDRRVGYRDVAPA